VERSRLSRRWQGAVCLHIQNRLPVLPGILLDKTAKCHYDDGMKKITVRMSDDTHKELCLIAEEQARSLNNQIVFFLQQAIERQRHAASESTNTRETPHHRYRKF
jgi:hypothetical protein